jgi:hypothetical protein
MNVNCTGTALSIQPLRRAIAKSDLAPVAVSVKGSELFPQQPDVDEGVLIPAGIFQ